MKYIELFAGCGGLSLGLESLNYKMVFANELSPMASETFAYNLLKENLQELADKKEVSTKVKWISSLYNSNQLAERLRENPQNYPKLPSKRSDLGDNLEDLYGKLIVGNIVDLNKHLLNHRNIINELQRTNIDLVSGGPPCQSFSMAGLRQLDNIRNNLPMDFAEFFGHVKPKIALLENVSGILRAFNGPQGKYYAWFEVSKAFVSRGYYPLCLHVNAKFTGAAQNRSRFIIIALRQDIFYQFKKSVSEEILYSKLLKIEKFFNLETSGEVTNAFKDLDCYDIERNTDLFETEIFAPLYHYKDANSWFTVKDAIDDLRKGKLALNKKEYFDYPNYINNIFRNLNETVVPHNITLNCAVRKNSAKIKMRFKLYQYLSNANSMKGGKEINRDVVKFLKHPTSHVLSKCSVDYLLQKKFLRKDGKSFIEFKNEKSLADYLSTLATKKHTQRALIADKPAPAALSIPDDACHYHSSLQRTLTVREMARFQSFPDKFEFRSKVTTGGKMRKFEVPQYTQVGNAVPPLLGRALGLVVKNILSLR